MLDSALFQADRVTVEDVLEFRRRYRDDIPGFALDVLGVELDENQTQIAQAVHDGKRVAVVSGRGIGKTWVEGVLALWYMLMFPGAEVRMLANTDAQSKTVLWRPMLRLLNGSACRDWFATPSTEEVHVKGDPNGPGIVRVVWSAHSVENVSGVHSPRLLYIMDEASKLPSELIDNILGGLSEADNRVLLCGNGTRSSGYFYNACQEGSGWNVLHIDSRSSRFTSREAIDDLIHTYGLESDTVRINVLGLFPRMGGSSIVPDAQIMAAMRREPAPTHGSAVVCGMDVGGGGDPTVWVVRDGLRIVAIEQDVSAGANEDALVRLTASVCERYRVARILVDSTGLGHFLPSRLTTAMPGVEVVGRNFGESSPDDAYANMRAWAFFRAREWFGLGVSIGDRPTLREELLAIEYRTDTRGKLALAPKDNVRAVLGRSPNEADALALSCAYPGDLSTLGVPLVRTAAQRGAPVDLTPYETWDD